MKGSKVPIPLSMLPYAQYLSDVVLVFQSKLRRARVLLVDDENKLRLELLVKDIDGNFGDEDVAKVTLEFLDDDDGDRGNVALADTIGRVLDCVLVQSFVVNGETVDPPGVAHSKERKTPRR